MPTSDINAFFEVLSYAECIDCLQKEEVGRLAWISDGQPTIVPVNYAWDGEAAVMRSDPGLKLNELRDADVAFEIDRIDRARKEGWSVVIRGRAQEVSVDDWPPHALPPDQLYLRPWAPGAKLHWVRLVPSVVTGRRISRVTEADTNPFWFVSS